MKIRKNKGFSKPALLTLSAVIVAAFGYGAYTYLNQNIGGLDTSSMDESTQELLQEVDLNSLESISAALYSAVLTENYVGVPQLVDRYRVLEFALKYNGASIPMTEEERTKPIDISPHLSGAAKKRLEEKIRYIDERLSSKQNKDSYKFYLSTLIDIFSFFQSDEPDIITLRESIDAYRAFVYNPTYTINDIRALYGAVDSLKVARYLMGAKDYSRISPIDMRDYITREVNGLINQIPVNTLTNNRPYSVTDFASLSVPTLKDVIKLNKDLPSIITNISLIDGLKKEDAISSYKNIKDKYNKTITSGLDFLQVAEIFYQCQATTSEPFLSAFKVVSAPFAGVAKSDKLSLDAYRVILNKPLGGCSDLREVYVLVPNAKEYETLFKRAQNKMSDDERATYARDLKFLQQFKRGATVDGAMLHLSDVAAVENRLERNPEQGYFVGKKEQGLLYNVTLDSFVYLSSLDIAPNVDQIFTQSKHQENKRNQARYKLAIIQDFKQVEQKMANFDFHQLETAPYPYINSLLVENAAMTFNFEDEKLLADINVTDTSPQMSDNDFNTDYTIEIATNEFTPEETYHNATFGDNTLAEVTADEVAEEQMHEITSSEEVGTYEIASSVAADLKPTNERASLELAQNATSKEAQTSVSTNTKAATTDAKTVVAVTKEPSKVETPTKEATSAIKEVASTYVKTEPSKTQDDKELAQTPKTLEEPPVVETPKKKDDFLNVVELKKAPLNEVQEQDKLGNPDATYELALRNINGKGGVRRNVDNARNLLVKATRQNHMPSAALLGNIYYTAPKSSAATRKEGAQYLLKAADAAISDAYFNAANILMEGKYAPKDVKKAVYYYTVASDQGDNKAQFALAKIYLEGTDDVAVSSRKAVNLLVASMNRNKDAALLLGDIYSGAVKTDIPPDEKRANEYYIVAARQGASKAYRSAGLALIKNKSAAREAEGYLTEALKNNAKDREINDALLKYYISTNNTRGVAKLIVNADAEIQKKFPVEMGILYEKGHGVKKDPVKAMALYREAIKQNIPSGFCRLGNLFEHGIGTKVDMRAAVGQYTRGANLSEPSCIRNLAYIKITHPNYQNYAEGYKLLQDLDGLGKLNKYDTAILGGMYLYGQGIYRNEQEGYRLLKQSHIPQAEFLSVLHSKNPEQLKSYACKNPVLSGAYGVISRNVSYIASASFSDLFFIKDLKDHGSSTTYDDMYLSAIKACRSSNASILYDANPKFKKPKSELTTNPAEQYRLGMIYFAGKGVQKNFVKAFTFMQKASEQNYLKAHNNLGVFYLLGIGTAQNGKLAFDAFSKAAASGDAKANFNAAAVRKGGIGIKPDHEKSMIQLVTAASKGYDYANMHLIFSYDYGNGNNKNDAQAFKYFATMVARASK